MINKITKTCDNFFKEFIYNEGRIEFGKALKHKNLSLYLLFYIHSYIIY